MTEGEFSQWCILELMGHRRMGGRVTESTIFGTSFLRLDIPDGQGGFVTQFYSPQAVYAITPTTEEIATKWGKQNLPEPVYQWELTEMTTD